MVSLNQRGFGVSLPFLVGLLITLMLLIPVFIGLARVWRDSKEAENNFLELAGKLRELQNDPVSHLLQMDANTAVAYFEPEQQQVKVYVQGIGKLNFYDSQTNHAEVFITRPTACSLEEGCLCLLRKPKSKAIYVDAARRECLGDECFSARIMYEVTLTGTTPKCEQDLPLLQINDCGIGTTHEVVEYHCSNGFVLEREVFSKTRLPGYLQMPRKVQLTLTPKEDNRVSITVQ